MYYLVVSLVELYFVKLIQILVFPETKPLSSLESPASSAISTTSTAIEVSLSTGTTASVISSVMIDPSQVVSPLSLFSRRSSSTTGHSSSATDNSSETQAFRPSPFFSEHDHEDQYPPPLPDCPLVELSYRNNGSSLVGSFAHRKQTRETVHQKQARTRNEEDERHIVNTMHKMATVCYQEMQDDKCHHREFKSVDDVADKINSLFGINGISGRQIREAVRAKRAGQLPPKRGRSPEIPNEEFEKLAELFFTLSAIEQSNANQRLTRAQLISLLANIVNQKRKQDRDPDLNEIW